MKKGYTDMKYEYIVTTIKTMADEYNRLVKVNGNSQCAYAMFTAQIDLLETCTDIEVSYELYNHLIEELQFYDSEGLFAEFTVCRYDSQLRPCTTAYSPNYDECYVSRAVTFWSVYSSFDRIEARACATRLKAHGCTGIVLMQCDYILTH